MNKLVAFLDRQPITRPLIESLRRLVYPANYNSTKYWIEQLSYDCPKYIVQIGAHDGKTDDPIYKAINRNRQWSCLFVEPIPYLYQRLKANHGDGARFQYEMAAIGDSAGSIPFYYIPESAFSAIPENYSQIGSFSREHVLSLSQGVVDDYITEMEVPCMTLNDLLTKHHIDDIHVLIIDAEGYDWKILAQLDLDTIKPDIILVEVLNLAEEEVSVLKKSMYQHYQLYRFKNDFLCVRPDILKRQKHSELEPYKVVH